MSELKIFLNDASQQIVYMTQKEVAAYQIKFTVIGDVQINFKTSTALRNW